jgi:glutamate-1-semialdehyde 2,1-aminomutase
MTTDNARFNTLFHGLLDRGIYIAPALYEAGFMSAAHTDTDIAETVAVAGEVFKLLSK